MKKPDIFDDISSGILVFSATIGLVFLIIKLRKIFWPIRVEASVRMIFDNSGPDEICAKITNTGNEPLYVVHCVARPTYSISKIIRNHIYHPFTHPRLYDNIRYAGQGFSFIDKEPLKLEPNQQIQLIHRRSSHPLAQFLAPMFLVELELSSKRKFRSARIAAPDRWMLARGIQQASN
mgnify:CR=1 FL=1